MENISQIKILIDTAWLLAMSLLIFFMNTGFAMLETGLCRVKNAVNILSKNVCAFFISTIAFWFIGFSLIFASGNQYIGFPLPENMFLFGSKDLYPVFAKLEIPLECIFFFQLVFCCVAASIISGAVAERIKFISFLIFTFAMSAFIFPVAAHWIVGKGFLYQLGVRDFAGSLMIHTLGGVAALTGVIILGPRVGKYNKDLSPNPILGHSISMVTLGGFIMWLGWFGFNLGCTYGFEPELCSHIAVCTNASGIMGGLGALIASWSLLRKPDLSMIINGLLAGLVSSTATSAYVTLVSAHIIGFIAGCLVVFSILAMDRNFHIDDPVGAISVHGISGIWGSIALGLYAYPNQILSEHVALSKPGLFYGGSFEQLISQVIGIGCIVTWSLLASSLFWLLIKYTIGLRVAQKVEIDGLNICEHGMEAYPGFSSGGESII